MTHELLLAGRLAVHGTDCEGEVNKYRVVKHSSFYSVDEVRYADDGSIVSSGGPVIPDAESFNELREMLISMRLACDEPVVDYDTQREIE